MRDQWKRSEAASGTSRRGKSSRRQKPTRGKQTRHNSEREHRPRRSPRQRRREKLIEAETERMLRQVEVEDPAGA